MSVAENSTRLELVTVVVAPVPMLMARKAVMAASVNFFGAWPYAVVAHQVGMVGAVSWRRIDHHSDGTMAQRCLADYRSRVSVGQGDLSAQVFVGIVVVSGACSHFDQLLLVLLPST